MKLKSFALTFLTLCVAAFAAEAKSAQAVSLSVLADGLDNPRNLDWDKDGNLYVTYSGRGGDGDGGQRCIPSPSAQYIPLCAGPTGGVIKIAPDGTKTNFLNNLTSIALVPSGEQAAGPADWKFDSQGNAYFLTGVAGDPNARDAILKSPDLGKLYKVDVSTGALTTLADFAAYESANNVDGSDLISNPYAFTIKGNTAYVVDGGANVVYSVGLDGSGIKNAKALPPQLIPTSQLEFPQLPEGVVDPTGGAPPPPGFAIAENGLPVSQQSIPTAITVAPDGTLTLAEYTYFPYPEGKARVYSINPDTLEATVIDNGYTQLTGVTYDGDGNRYLLQHINQSEWKGIQQGGIITGDISGSIIKVALDGTKETIWSGNGLEAASGLFFGPDGYLYTANRARLAETGQVLRIDPRTGGSSASVPEPASLLGLFTLGTIGAATKLRKRKRQEELGEEVLAKVETI
ncbi:ScyD/ScyE family protein [Iningainema tapete]|uniref:ScyD/ScyE family protein n=1 Tax=Iningainema tapete BLCC-T55 TaxID=2748662 RepID=A0A8J6XEL6_9CYAN|nr:ScyD/ScyE family protein [Iningainema tapete]MBD2775055.1 ScyD/ScyE family protein [Iningainema tapete BLCC-T55]